MKGCVCHTKNKAKAEKKKKGWDPISKGESLEGFN